jgi:hypothetical protein
MVSSLHGTEGQQGPPQYPDFATRFNEAIIDPTRLELEGVLVRDLDLDQDGLPDDWERFYFADTVHSASDDPDQDGAVNEDELRAGTDPADAQSVFRVLTWTRQSQGALTLVFPHAASRRYTIEFGDLSGLWDTATNAPLFRLGAGLAEWTEPKTAFPLRIYRVRAD